MEPKQKQKVNLKLIFILLAFAFISQSIVYLLKGANILNLDPNFTFFYTPFTKQTTIDKVVGAILFVSIFGGLAITYFLILKHQKKLFHTNQDMAKFILIVAMMFFVMLPLTSTDVFYYMGTGWSQAHYEVNPYYTSVESILKDEELYDANSPDEMLLRMPRVWRDTTIVYGPVWPFICNLLSGLSGGNVALGLFIYKLFNLMLYLLSCYLIFKITKGKKWATLLFALNPLLLFDGLANVHNDLLVVFLILLGLYFFLRKKNMTLTIISLALATGVKYFAILLVPFLVIYYYRKEKPAKRMLYACGWAVLFIVILVGCYLLYTRDLQVLKGILTQQSKFMNSMFLVIALHFGTQNAALVSKGCMLGFIVIYLMSILKLLFTKKEISFTGVMREYSWLLVLFIFGTITNFQSWYLLWLLPTIFWQKGKTASNLLTITIAGELANTIFFVLFEYFKYGQYYYAIFLALIFLLTKVNIHKIITIGEESNETIIEAK